MSRPFVVVVVLVLLVGAAFGAMALLAKWEYRIVAAPDAEFAQTMDAFGRAGWELASARRAISDRDRDGDGSNDASYEIIMKRPVRWRPFQ